jgi:TPR repeat protein
MVVGSWLVRVLQDDPGYRASGVRTPLTLRLSVALLQTNARFGHADAQYRLGAAYANGRAVAHDLAMARRWYRRAAEQGHVAAQFELGELCAFSRPSEGPEAVRWWRAAAEQGHFEAQYRLADAYGRAWLTGVPLNPGEAVHWWQRMAASGSLEFKQRLAWAFSTGWGAPQDPEAAVRIWSRLAASGDVESTCQLGLAYAAGAGVARDSAQALRLWLRETDQQHRVMPDCWHALCRAYALGDGAPRDELEAARWCRRLAGDPILNGTIDQEALDNPAARSWVTVSLSRTRLKRRECGELLAELFPALLRRARAGESRAQYAVAVAYSTGRGVSYDRAEALRWYRRAAAQGDDGAQKVLAVEEANAAQSRRPVWLK